MNAFTRTPLRWLGKAEQGQQPEEQEQSSYVGAEWEAYKGKKNKNAS
ncbi:hypothetical protein SAMN00120144_3670 [Hymenobacter roseosalivarius DSM 11622]|uniref:Uncharacterized protein n=1 Tax=Hymenobacter roseosalivarius DSM 11622 TaxID=645990 RepID=A0A1W1W0Y7_9BACT|nr:hypothetical protein SAMN00120144_3670 [Hymenobacter roseosalivarius DSM 11622]